MLPRARDQLAKEIQEAWETNERTDRKAKQRGVLALMQFRYFPDVWDFYTQGCNRADATERADALVRLVQAALDGKNSPITLTQVCTGGPVLFWLFPCVLLALVQELP